MTLLLSHLPHLHLLAQASVNPAATVGRAAGALLAMIVIFGVAGLITLFIMSIQALALQGTVEFVNGERPSFWGAFLTIFLLFLLGIGIGVAQYFHYASEFTAHGGDLSTFSHMSTASPDELQKFHTALQATYDPLARWINLGIWIVLAGLLVSWRHTHNFVQGILVYIAVVVIYLAVVFAGVAAIIGGAKAHLLLAP